mgnify:CR=1 FL=1
MAKNKKVIISCAVTGAIHTPSMSEYLPVTADEVIEHSLAAHEAGAAVLHLHARDEIDGHPTQDPEEFQKFLPTIQSSCDAVINITTGGGPQMTVEDRMRPAMHFKPELASLNMGSMNFGLFPMLKKHNQLKFPWEKEMLERSKHSLFKNTFRVCAIKTNIIEMSPPMIVPNIHIIARPGALFLSATLGLSRYSKTKSSVMDESKRVCISFCNSEEITFCISLTSVLAN